MPKHYGNGKKTHKMPDGSTMKNGKHKAKKSKQPAKGSAAMKAKMAKLRAMRKKK